MALLFLCLPQFVVAGTRVVDGDTIVVEGVKYRLFGIDAPETRQVCYRDGREWACGRAATAFVQQMAADRAVLCEERARDRYGRIVAICRADGVDLGAALTRAGLAWAYLKYSDLYAPEENAARDAHVGVWNGSAIAPWEYRKAMRQPKAVEVAATPSVGCDIKGNISANGRIFHMPGSEAYGRTRISTQKGERWFCSVEVARAAGWRAPLR
ncbi:MAG: thermonuclease family protein [Pikeienuella sp.]